MNQQERDVCESMMRQLPCDLVYIEGFIAKPEQRERTLKFCEFLECNEEVLAHRILGWKQYKCKEMPEKKSCQAKPSASET